jgi:hypothetical protein
MDKLTLNNFHKKIEKIVTAFMKVKILRGKGGGGIDLCTGCIQVIYGIDLPVTCVYVCVRSERECVWEEREIVCALQRERERDWVKGVDKNFELCD